MPFTPTHALAIVPVTRWLPLSALVVGSMIPDWPLYFDLGPGYQTTHSFPGLITACLPAGVIAWLLFHALVKRPSLALLPVWWRQRLAGPALAASPFEWRAAPGVVLALLAGSLTHIVWDAFTHEGRWGVQAIGVLSRSYSLAGFDVPGYAIFQHGASAVGLPWLAYLVVRAVRRLPPVAAPDPLPLAARAFVVALLLLAPIGAAFAAIGVAGAATHEWLLVRWVTAAGAVFVVLCLLLGALYTGWQALTRDR